MIFVSIASYRDKELIKTADLIKEDLTAIGIKVDIKTFEIEEMNKLDNNYIGLNSI